ncbi:MAG: hypothetical protein OYH76_21635 [Defluviicoccus sp.]|nr:hypothetical protein [Defluviicoccus sp.]MDE0278507.1 hypothetical protein [Defluviicoccus sp.]
MSYVSEYLTQAEPVNRWTVQARAEQLRGEVMRQMASALKRKIVTVFAGPGGHGAAGQAV